MEGKTKRGGAKPKQIATIYKRPIWTKLLVPKVLRTDKITSRQTIAVLLITLKLPPSSSGQRLTWGPQWPLQSRLPTGHFV